MKKVFILYDGRAKSEYGGDTDNAVVLVTARSEAEAIRDSKDWAKYDAVWYEYDLVNGIAENEKERKDIGKGLFL